MRPVPFEHPDWERAATLSGAKAATLVPYMRRLMGTDLTNPEGVDDWIKVLRELVDGSDVSSAADLVLPWFVESSRGKSLAEQAQVWGLVGEVELGALTDGNASSKREETLKAAAEVALERRGEGTGKMLNEHSAMIAALHQLPDWGRVFLLRLVLMGLRYIACPECGELLDIEWERRWLVGRGRVTQGLPNAQRSQVLQLIRETAIEHRAPALEAVEQLSGTVQCPSCSATNDCMAMIAHPRRAP